MSYGTLVPSCHSGKDRGRQSRSSLRTILRNSSRGAEFLCKGDTPMRRFRFALYLVLTSGFGLAPNVDAQSLPEEAGPTFGNHSAVPSEEAITNPGGFGKYSERKK